MEDVCDPPRQRLQLEARDHMPDAHLDIGAMVAHVLMMLAERAGVAAGHAQVIAGPAPAALRIVLAYQAEQATCYLAQTAVDLVVALLHERPFPLEERIAEARRIAAQTELGQIPARSWRRPSVAESQPSD